MKKFILSIDQGTTGSTALLVDFNSLEIVAKSNEEFRQIFPKDSWVEHDLNDIFDSVKSTIQKVLLSSNISPSQIVSIGITNQRETTCAYKKSNGSPLANAIVWQDRRTTQFCQEQEKSYRPYKKLTGLPLDPYFSGTKMKWLLDNNAAVKNAAKESDLYFSTIDSYLLYRLSGCKSFATEPSNASRTLLLDINTGAWNKELLNFFGIQKEYLPEIKNTFDDFGKTYGLNFLPDNIPINCLIGDQQAALLGQLGINNGDIKCTYGTGAFILMNTGSSPVFTDSGLLTTIAFKSKNEIVYALEGSSYIAGAAVQWLRDNLKIINKAADIEELASKITDTELIKQLFFFPFFSGIGSPYWRPEARAAIIGMTRDTSNEHISRACLEGIAMSIADSLNKIIEISQKEITSVFVDGGAARNDLLMQIQADVLGLDIIRPTVIETTALGAAIGSYIYQNGKDLSELSDFKKVDKQFKKTENTYLLNKYSLWKKLINKHF